VPGRSFAGLVVLVGAVVFSVNAGLAGRDRGRVWLVLRDPPGVSIPRLGITADEAPAGTAPGDEDEQRAPAPRRESPAPLD
jgi:hypothetical protein